MARIKTLALIALIPLLSGCPGEMSTVPAQPAAPRVEMSGTVTDGTVTTQYVIAKGTSGTPRQVTSSASGAYVVSLTDLAGPFLLTNTLSPDGDPHFSILSTVATRGGVVNVTPLTTLLTAQLFGLDPAEVITSYNNSDTIKTALVTDANIQAAQASVAEFLADSYGVLIKSGVKGFVDSPFSPAAGDPMFDTIQALNAALAAKGKTVRAVAQQLALGVRACQAEAVQLNMDGREKKLCPVFKSATPEEADTSIVDYVFQDAVQNTLTLKAQGTTALSFGYQSTSGDSFTCASACMGITVSALSGDLTRTITFANAGLTSPGSGGTVVLTGTLVTAIPSITLPSLTCADNRFFVIFPNHDVVGDCVSVQNPTLVAATFGSPSGPGRDFYAFSSGPAVPPTVAPGLQIVLDHTTDTPSVVSVYYIDSDPGSGEVHNRFLCMLSACNGVTFSPAKMADTGFGFSVEVRSLNLNDTVLSGLNEDGTPTGTSVTARGSLVIARDASQQVSYPTLLPCGDPTEDAIDVRASGAEFNICVYPNDRANGFLYRTAKDLGNGELLINISGDAGDQIYVDLKNGALAYVEVALQGSTSESFKCSTDCVGVTVSGPDSSGRRTTTFDGTVLHLEQLAPVPGDRTLKLTSPGLSVDPL